MLVAGIPSTHLPIETYQQTCHKGREFVIVILYIYHNNIIWQSNTIFIHIGDKLSSSLANSLTVDIYNYERNLHLYLIIL